MELVALRERIEYVNKRLEELQRDFASDPDLLTLGLQIRNLTRHRDELEEDWVKLAGSLGHRVCAYRIHTPSGAQPSVRAVSEVLAAFQKSFTAVYDGKKSGTKKKKLRANTTKAIRDITSFRFDFASPGSLIVMLTINKTQFELWDESADIEKTVDTIYDISQADGPEGILAHVHQIGTPAVHSVYKWIECHAKHDFGLHLMWEPGLSDQRRDIRLPRSEVKYLRGMIETAEKRSTDRFEVQCSLVGWDTERKLFRLRLDKPIDDRLDVMGKIDDSLDISDGVIVPAKYEATITRTTREKVATEKIDESYVLKGLRFLQSGFESRQVASAIESKQLQEPVSLQLVP